MHQVTKLSSCKQLVAESCLIDLHVTDRTHILHKSLGNKWTAQPMRSKLISGDIYDIFKELITIYSNWNQGEPRLTQIETAVKKSCDPLQNLCHFIRLLWKVNESIIMQEVTTLRAGVVLYLATSDICYRKHKTTLC